MYSVQKFFPVSNKKWQRYILINAQILILRKTGTTL